jgi:hypothetical protein
MIGLWRAKVVPESGFSLQAPGLDPAFAWPAARLAALHRQSKGPGSRAEGGKFTGLMRLTYTILFFIIVLYKCIKLGY